uniref:RiboL-PSP-HEPN domain-containing protein n=1 Tax=Agrobacterium rosae TaxID=1972867 RepID=A0ABU4W6B8_9HYPH|nr:hypothetical protein [Agrobacterium rosae]MDX8332997.1 hypothetical protein [Agrobacterium rosae]
MRTKPFQRFVARLAEYESDLEIADVLTNTFINKVQNTDTTICAHLGKDPADYPKLASRTNTKQSRKVIGIHLKKTLFGSSLKDFYEDFSEFLQKSIEHAALKGVDYPRLLAGSGVDMKMVDVLRSGSWEAMIAKMSEQLFRSLENERSTITLIRKFNDKLNLGLDQQVIDDAMPYLDARHILVHRDGKVDDYYSEKYPDIRKDNGKIKVDFQFITEARNKIHDLARHINDRLLAEDLCPQSQIVN